MPPTDVSDQAAKRYLTRLVTAIVLQNGGELRVPKKFIRKVEEECARQMLSEDTDTKKDELVLRFGSKHSAVYPVEPECLTPPSRPASTTASPFPHVGSRLPQSAEELKKIEEAIKARRIKAQLRQRAEGKPNNLSEILESDSTT